MERGALPNCPENAGYDEISPVRLLSDPQSDNCLIEGEGDADADKMFFGAFLESSGAAWIDGFKLAFRDSNNQWQPIPIVNGSFEEGDRGHLPGWSMEANGQSVTTVADAHVTAREPP